jgi:protein gp37
MAENSNIEWCDHTFNPVIGCQKVSAGCDFCYAETLMDKRYHRVQWGPHGERLRTSASNWYKPIAWEKKAREFYAVHKRRQRVFCASLSDVFDNKWAEKDRADLWALIERTPNLDWLLLTKRPENIGRMLGLWEMGIPPNVWLGTTCEDQAAYDRRWPILQQFNVRVRFISYEPAIGPLNITRHKVKPDWLICGGESGPGHRDMPEQWAYDVMEQCEEESVPFLMKQMAGKKPIPGDLLVRQYPSGAAYA